MTAVPPVPEQAVTDEMILAAQNYDMAHRGESIAALWRAAPDRQVARLIAGAAPLIRAEAGKRRIPADDEMHELAFTDREARPAKWETRCGRADVPLERAGSADPGMQYPVTCKACLRIAGLNAALKRFEHLEEAAIAAAVRRGIDQAVATVTRFEVIDRAVAPARSLVRYGVHAELSWQDGDRTLKVFLRDRKPCCDLHGRNCEPPSELCCEACTEVAHPRHADGSECSAPDLSGAGS